MEPNPQLAEIIALLKSTQNMLLAMQVTILGAMTAIVIPLIIGLRRR